MIAAAYRCATLRRGKGGFHIQDAFSLYSIVSLPCAWPLLALDATFGFSRGALTGTTHEYVYDRIQYFSAQIKFVLRRGI
jgi:hypothetical protein